MPEDPEIGAMSKVSAALAGLEEDARVRVLDWAAKKYGVTLIPTEAQSGREVTPGEVGGTPEEGGSFAAFVDLFDKASPKIESERALVGGYWFQVISGHSSFDAHEVNNALKDVGHGIGNITQSFNSLQNRKPALVRQMSKSGKTKQARKTYKLTTAGSAEVGRMLVGAPPEE